MSDQIASFWAEQGYPYHKLCLRRKDLLREQVEAAGNQFFWHLHFLACYTLWQWVQMKKGIVLPIIRIPEKIGWAKRIWGIAEGIETKEMIAHRQFIDYGTQELMRLRKSLTRMYALGVFKLLVIITLGVALWFK